MASGNGGQPAHTLIYQDRAYIRQKVPTDTIVPYISDVNSVSLRNRTGEEIPTVLEPADWAADSKVTVTHRAAIFMGRLVARDEKYVTLSQEGGRILVTKYDSLLLEPSMAYPDSYVVSYLVEEGRSIPELLYLTTSITWRPVVCLDIEVGRISLVAVINSTRASPFNSELTVAAYDDATPSGRATPMGLMRKGGAAASAPITSESDDPPDRFFTFDIGQAELGRSLRFPMFSHAVEPACYNLIDLNVRNSQLEGPAVVSYMFKTPIRFPSSELEISAGDYQNSYPIKPHQKDQLMIVRTYASAQVRYQAAISDIVVTDGRAGASSTVQGPTRRRVEIDLNIEKLGNDVEKVLILFSIRDVKLVEIEPEPVRSISLAGKLVWILNLKGNVKKILKVTYDV